MKTKITIVVAFIFVAGSVVLAVRNSNPNRAVYGSLGGTSAGSESLNPNASSTIPGSPNGAVYTMAQVSSHKDAVSCWTTISGSVYDVTAWIKQHPGGADAILSLCGKDGSVAFDSQHGGQRRPANELAGFKIGTLSGAIQSAAGTASVSAAPTGVSDDQDDD